MEQQEKWYWHSVPCVWYSFMDRGSGKSQQNFYFNNEVATPVLWQFCFQPINFVVHNDIALHCMGRYVQWYNTSIFVDGLYLAVVAWLREGLATCCSVLIIFRGVPHWHWDNLCCSAVINKSRYRVGHIHITKPCFQIIFYDFLERASSWPPCFI